MFGLPLLTVVLFVTGCKKYEENPLINLWSKKHRLVATTGYVLTSYEVNGIDSTATVPNIGMINFYEDENQRIVQTAFLQGEWNFYDHKKSLQIFMYPNTDGYLYGALLAPVKLNWRITKLTDRELHLTIDYQGKNYAIHLNKKE